MSLILEIRQRPLWDGASEGDQPRFQSARRYFKDGQEMFHLGTMVQVFANRI